MFTAINAPAKAAKPAKAKASNATVIGRKTYTMEQLAKIVVETARGLMSKIEDVFSPEHDALFEITYAGSRFITSPSKATLMSFDAACEATALMPELQARGFKCFTEAVIAELAKM